MPKFTALGFQDPNTVIQTRTALSNGDDETLGGATNELFSGNNGNDQIAGGLGQDYLLGNAGDDTLDGGKGIDTLFGGQGDDILTGGQSKDFLSGDFGNDTLNGGAGDDTFYFDARTTTTGLDQVTDFKAVDTLALDGITAASIREVGDDVVLSIGGRDAVTFTDVNLSRIENNTVDGDGNAFIFV